jgi:hypothetical protein
MFVGTRFLTVAACLVSAAALHVDHVGRLRPRGAARCPASPLLDAQATVSAITLMRQSDVLEVLSSVADAALTDHSGATSANDVVSLGLVRHVGIGEESGGVTLELELPADAVTAGAGDRVQRSRQKKGTRRARACAALRHARHGAHRT